MAETLAARSPLQDYAAHFTDAPAAARVAEEPFIAMVDLWVDPEGPGGDAAARALGVQALPTAPSTVVTGDVGAVIWFGPQELLVTSSTRTGEALERALREAIAEHGGAAVDVSAQRTTLRLTGPRARDVLAKGTPLNLHPADFPPGAAAQTMLGQAAVVLMPVTDDGTDYRILVRSSFARHLAEWLLDATLEFA